MEEEGGEWLGVAVAERLQLRITDVAKQRIERFLRESGLTRPTPGLLFGTKNNGREEWYIGAYGEDQVSELEKILAPKGYALRYEADGIDLLVPQPQLVAQLDGKTLDYYEDHYIVL